MVELLSRARAEGHPLVDGETVTFLWRGAAPPQLIGDFNDWGRDDRPLKLRAVAPGVWARRLAFPRDAYMEYAFVRDTRRLRDPLNSRTIWNGVSAYNSFFYMPEAAPTSLARRRRDVPRGALTRHVIAAPWLVAGGKRAVHLYQPPTTRPCPLIVVYDGPDYLRRARLVTLVENLIAQQRIRPVALAFVANGGEARFIEYACGESTLLFVAAHVLPLARAHLNLLDPARRPGAFGVLGASMGGLMALYTGLRLPRIFGSVISQSGAFTVEDPGSVIWDLVRDGDPRPIKIWMDVGRYDIPSLIPGNRRMRKRLAARGYDVTYREYNAGHNFTAWRDEVWRGLATLFSPGSLLSPEAD
jgi:enterochelin esterase family protein